MPDLVRLEVLYPSKGGVHFNPISSRNSRGKSKNVATGWYDYVGEAGLIGTVGVHDVYLRVAVSVSAGYEGDFGTVRGPGGSR